VPGAIMLVPKWPKTHTADKPVDPKWPICYNTV
jgi:hypothetical protein